MLKNEIKKLGALVLAAALSVTGVAGVPGITVKAESSASVNVEFEKEYRFNATAGTSATYKVTLPQSGQLKFDYSVTSTSSFHMARFALTNEQQTELDSFREYADNKIETRTYSLIGGSYYFTITGVEKNAAPEIWALWHFTPSGETHVETQNSQNNTQDTAISISSGETVIGHFGDNDSVDYYKINIPAKSVVTISKLSEGSSIPCISFKMFGAAQLEEEQFWHTDSATQVADEGICYLMISPWSNNGSSYSFRLTVRDYGSVIPTPKLTEIPKSAIDPAFTVQWAPVSGIDGYQLQVSEDSGFTTLLTDTTRSRNDTKYDYYGEWNHTYYCRLRTYVNIYGVDHYSDWSTAKSVAINVHVANVRLTNVSQSASKPYLNMYWDDTDNATGYQIQISTKKNFSKKLVNKKLTAPKSCRYTYKGKYKKTYYCRVRAFATYNGKTVYSSSWSKAKKIKLKK